MFWSIHCLTKIFFHGAPGTQKASLHVNSFFSFDINMVQAYKISLQTAGGRQALGLKGQPPTRVETAQGSRTMPGTADICSQMMLGCRDCPVLWGEFNSVPGPTDWAPTALHPSLLQVWHRWRESITCLLKPHRATVILNVPISPRSVFLGQWEGSVGKDACYQTWQPELNFWDHMWTAKTNSLDLHLHGVVSTKPHTHTYIHVHTHAQTHAHTHTCTHTPLPPSPPPTTTNISLKCFLKCIPFASCRW